VRFRNLLSELSGERIVILSTHIVSDVEAVATDIAILNHGLLLAHDSPESLLAAISGKVWEIVVPSAALSVIQQQHLISSTAHRSDGVHVRVVSPSPPTPQAQPLEPTLEDAYLASIASSRTAAAGGAS
jgi:ABC-2 type transport system ATP-binding protein